MRPTVPFLGLLLLAGCATPTHTAADPASATPSVSAAPTPSVVATATPPAASPSIPPAQPEGTTVKPPYHNEPAPGSDRPPTGEITVTGTIVDGVERGCTLLRTAKELYLLVGEAGAWEEGTQVAVRGRPNPGLLTTCQQGVPLMVTEVRVL